MRKASDIDAVEYFCQSFSHLLCLRSSDEWLQRFLSIVIVAVWKAQIMSKFGIQKSGRKNGCFNEPANSWRVMHAVFDINLPRKAQIW